jgi:threonine dehydratase
MLPAVDTPLIRLSNLFPNRQVYAKCEFLAPSGCFKIHGAVHLLRHLSREDRCKELVVPSMGNTALGAAVGAKLFGFSMVGVVPQTIARAKDEKLRALGVELLKISGGGSELLKTARQVAAERGAYFVHPHLDPLWTDGYQVIARQILDALPECRSLVFPVGGGGLLMGLSEFLQQRSAAIKLHGCEPYNYPKYASFDHPRAATIADGLLLEVPHPEVQKRIEAADVPIHLIAEPDIRAAMAELYRKHALVVEPSSAIALALVPAHAQGAHAHDLEEPCCVILTGANIAPDDFSRLIAQ